MDRPKIYIYHTITLIILFSGVTANATDYFFRNVANLPGCPLCINPEPTLWSNPVNWSGNYPGTTIDAGDKVVVVGNCEIDVDIINNGTIAFEYLLSSFNSHLNNGQKITNNSTIELKSHNLNNFGTILNYGQISLISQFSDVPPPVLTNTGDGLFTNSNTITIGATCELSNLNIFTDLGTTNNSGIVRCGSTGTFEIWSSNFIVNVWESGGIVKVTTLGSITQPTLNVPSGGILEIEGDVTADVFNSLGTVKLKTGGKLTVNNPTWNMPSNFSWEGGRLILGSAVNMLINTPLGITDGELEIKGTVTVNADNGLLTQDKLVIVENGGKLFLNAKDSIDFKFQVKTGGEVSIGSSGSMTINGLLSLPLGSTLINNGILRNNSDLLSNAGTFTNNGTCYIDNRFFNTGTLINNGTLANDYAYIINSGIFTNSGSLSITQYSNLHLGVYPWSDYLSLHDGITNTGSINLEDGSNLTYIGDTITLLQGTVDWKTGAEITLAANRKFPLSSNFSIPTGRIFINNALINTSTFNISNLGSLTNNSTINLDSGSEFTNSGTFSNQSGTLNLNSGSEFLVSTSPSTFPSGTIGWNGGLFKVTSLGQLDIASPITLPLNSIVQIDGDLNINTSGSLAVNGTLNNNGNINLNGTGLVSGIGSLILNSSSFYNINTPVFSNIPSLIIPLSGSMVTLGSSSTFNLTSTYDIPSNASFRVQGNLNVNSGGDLNIAGNLLNYGTISVSGNGELSTSGAGSFEQYVGNFILNNNTPTTLANLLVSGGMFTIGSDADVTLTNNLNATTGVTINIQGIVRSIGGVTNNGNITLSPSGKLYLSYSPISGSIDSFNWQSGGYVSIMSGASSSLQENLSIPSGSILDIDGSLQMAPGVLTLASSATVNLNSGSLLSISAPLINSGSVNIKSGGEYSISYDIPVPSANFNWEVGGTLASGGGAYLSLLNSYTVPTGRILKMDGGVFSVNKKLTNDGIINLTGNLNITDTLEQNKDLNFGLLGKIRLQSTGVLVLNDTISYAVTDTIHNDGGLVKINQGGALIGDGVVELKGGPVTATNGRLCLNQTIPDFDLTKIVWNDGSSIIIGENSSYDWPDGFTIPANKKFQIDGLMTIKTDSTLENNGYLTVNGTLNDNGTLNNNAVGTFTNNGLSNINGIFFNNGEIENTDILNLNATGALTLNTGNISLDGTFNWLEGGDLTIGLNANMYLSNTLTVPSASTLNVDGLLEIRPNGVIANNGTLSLNNGGEFVIKDTTSFITSTNFIWNSGANIRIAEGGLVSLSQPFTVPINDTLNLDRGVLELNPGAIVTNNGSIELNAYGNIILKENPDFLVAGNFNWNNQGQVTIGTGMVFNMTSDLNVAYSGVLENNGKIIIDSDQTLTNLGVITNNDSLINNGTLINTNSGNSQINNYGFLLNNGTITSNKLFYHHGKLILNTPGIVFPYTAFQWLDGANVTIGPNGIFDLSSQISFSSNSELNIEGVLNLNTGGSIIGKTNIKNGGTLGINLTASVDGTSFLSTLIQSYTWQQGGTLEVGSSGNLTSVNGFSIPQNSILSVSGTYNLESYATTDPEITNNGTLEVNSGGVFNQKHALLNNGSVLINGGGRMNQRAAINNLGPLDLNSSGILSYGQALFPYDSVPLLSAENFNWNGGTVEIPANSTVSLEDEFTIPAGRTFSNLGTLNINTNGVLTHIGTLTNSGILDLKAGGEYRIKKALAGTPSGTFNWTSGKLTIDTASVFNLTTSLLIPTTGTLSVVKDAIFNINSGGTLSQEGALDINQGQLNLNTAGIFALNKPNAALPTTGFTWNAGTIQLTNTASFALSNVIDIPTGGIFELDGTLTINNGGSVNNLGDFNLNNNAVLAFDATSAMLPTGNFNWASGGDIHINNGSTLSLVDSLGIPVNSALTNNGTLDINNLGIVGNSGTYNGTGITNLNSGGKYLILNATTGVPNANFNWNTGGIFEISSTGSLTLGDSLTIPYQRQLINKGQLNINQNGVLTQMGTLDNQGTFDLNDMGYLILKTSPLDPTPISVTYPNGNFNWNNGGVIKIDSFTVFDNAAPFTVVANRELIICGTFNNSSTLDINGKISLAGNLTNTDAINLKLAGELNFLTPTVTFPAGNFDWQEGGDIRISPQSTLTLASSLTVPEFSSLSNEGILTINSSGVLVLNGGLSGSGTLNLNSGGKYLANSTVNPSLTLMNWNPGGEIEIGASGIMEIEEPFEIPYGGIFTNKGTVNIGDGSFFSTAKLTQSGTFDNSLGNLILQPYGTLEYKTSAADPGPSIFAYPTGTFDWQSAGIVKIAANTVFDNQSPFDVKVSRELIVDGTFENNSTLAINGTLTANGDLTNESTGIINLNNGGNLVIYKEDFLKPGNTFNWASGGTFTVGDTGSMDVTTAFGVPTGGILNIEGVISLKGAGVIDNLGTIELSFGGDLLLDYDDAPLPTGNFNWNGRVTFAENRTFNISENYVVPSSGNLKNEGIVFINSDVSLNIDGLFFNDSLLTNNGTIEVNEFGYIANYVGFTNNDTLLNKGTIENYGPFINAANGNFINRLDFYNYDTLYNHGILSGANGKIYAETDSEIENLTGSKVSPGEGQLSGKIDIRGDFDLGNTTLNTKIDGTNSGDLVDVRDHANLTNAALDVKWLSNPVNNQIDTVLAFGTKTGEFSSVNIEALSGYTFTVNYLANAVVIQSVSDCQTSVSETSSLSGTQTISSGQSINASSVISINARVTFSTGGSIILEPGFKTGNNSVFIANIDGGCLD